MKVSDEEEIGSPAKITKAKLILRKNALSFGNLLSQHDLFSKVNVSEVRSEANKKVSIA